MKWQLSDKEKFDCLANERDKTEKYESQIITSLKELKTNNHIDKKVFEQLTPCGTHVPRLYGLPKVHKPGLPLRPIIDMIDSPYHNVAQWIAKLLEPVRRQISCHSLKDTFEFVDQIKERNINTKQMLSFDVESLFTNIPLLETVDYLCDFISSNNIEIGLPPKNLKELILRCTYDVQFLFNNKLYRQRDGVAMGSPLGPTLADIFMSKLESGPLNGTISKFDVYLRYMDDTFIICDKQYRADELLDSFNRCHYAVKFTMEREQNDCLSFLDVHLRRTETGVIRRKVFRKITWNGQYSHFKSFVPVRYKQNLVNCLAYRARAICSEDTLKDELQNIQGILKENGYPDQFVKRHMELKQNKPQKLDVPKKQLFLSVPFKGDKSLEILRQRLNNVVSSTFTAARLCLLPRTQTLICQRTKDKLPQISTNMCLYNFTSNWAYAGQSNLSWFVQ